VTRLALSFLLVLVCAKVRPTFAYADAYYCPMKCEGEKTYPKPGECPKCGMDLVKKGEPRQFRVELKGSEAVAGVATVFPLVVTQRTDGAAVADAEADVYVVSQDLGWFFHERAKGEVKVTFPAGGNYVAFAAFRTEVAIVPIKVSGPERKPVPLKLNRLWKKIRLTNPKRGVLAFQGAKEPGGAVVAVSEDLTELVLFHPGKKPMEFHGTFPRPGRYKVWLEHPSFLAEFALVAPERRGVKRK
jgi:hypothetical protein